VRPDYPGSLCLTHVGFDLWNASSPDIYRLCETEPEAMLIGYARTSTVEQIAGLEAQKEALQRHGCEKVFSEHISSVNAERLELTRALDWVRDGDALVIVRLDRLSRSVSDLLRIVERLERKGVGLRILDFGGSAVDTKSPTGKLLVTMFAAVAAFERDIMLERQLSGIARARAEGKYKGRAPTARRQAKAVLELHRAGVAPTKIAAELGISRASVYRILNESGGLPAEMAA
jgi:DNA invertase Pin-like site-specific DNA recombinase